MIDRPSTNKIAIAPELVAIIADRIDLVVGLRVDGEDLRGDQRDSAWLSELAKMSETGGSFWPLTCLCGDPGCGGYGPILVRHDGSTLAWFEEWPGGGRNFSFDAFEFRNAVRDAVTQAEAMILAEPGVVAVHSEDWDVFPNWLAVTENLEPEFGETARSRRRFANGPV